MNVVMLYSGFNHLPLPFIIFMCVFLALFIGAIGVLVYRLSPFNKDLDEEIEDDDNLLQDIVDGNVPLEVGVKRYVLDMSHEPATPSVKPEAGVSDVHGAESSRHIVVNNVDSCSFVNLDVNSSGHVSGLSTDGTFFQGNVGAGGIVFLTDSNGKSYTGYTDGRGNAFLNDSDRHTYTIQSNGRFGFANKL